MIALRRLIPASAAAFLAFAAVPAAACDTGPFGIDFVRGTTRLTKDSRVSLHYMGSLRTESPNSRIRITIYNDGVSRPVSLWKARLSVALARLRAGNVPPASIDVVRVKTRGGMLGRYWIGRATSMQVEQVHGCGG